MKIVCDHDLGCLLWVRARGKKRRARQVPSSGEVFLLIALTPEPPESGRGQAIKGLLKHYTYCQEETGDWKEGWGSAPPKAATLLRSQLSMLLSTLRVRLCQMSKSNLMIIISWDTLRGGAKLEVTCTCLLYRDRRKSESSSQNMWVTILTFVIYLSNYLKDLRTHLRPSSRWTVKFVFV